MKNQGLGKDLSTAVSAAACGWFKTVIGKENLLICPPDTKNLATHCRSSAGSAEFQVNVMTVQPRLVPVSDNPAPASQQERINQEMFRAIERLGRKLERAETERASFSQVLAQIESAAERDEKTGKIYLPMLVQAERPPVASSRWQSALSVASSVIALLAVGLVLYREPAAAPQLTAAQLAALDSLTETQFARMNGPSVDPANNIDISRFTQTTSTPVAAPVETAAEEASEEQKVEIAQIEQQLTPEELSAIEPAAGDATAPAAEILADEKPAAVVVTAPAAAEAPVETVTAAEKPLAQPANDAAPIPLAAAMPTVEQKAIAAGETVKDETVTGIDRDQMLPAAYQTLEARAFAGVAAAQHDLAALYVAGTGGVQRDYGRAVFWFTKSAEKGMANAHYNLGVMYQQGLGVPQDAAAALGWYERAAQLGHPEAMYNLGIANIEGIGADRNIARGVAFFKQAANAGVSQAAYNLGVLYESNFIGPADLTKAAEWYQTAANEGHAEAKKSLARLSGPAAEPYAGDAEDVMAKHDETEYGQGDETTPDEEVAAMPAKKSLAPTSEQGDDLVKRIQEALLQRGEIPHTTVPGEMNVQTEAAIRSWQKSLGWNDDGLPSRELLEKIEGNN